ncbi:MAG: ABC transporter permease [Akkermansiaceae bacterium]|nr:ABC transporter permease [Armatimonadota bacterium]
MKYLAPLWKRYAPECVSVGLLVLVLVVTAVREPRFFDTAYLFDRSTLYMEAGLLTLAMTLVIVAGHIDLSVTSILALVGAIVATLHARLGIPLGVLIPLAPVLGAGFGWINGALVAKRKLPSLVVTLATMALYRGGAQILLGDQSVPMPRWFVGVEKVSVPGTYFHVPLILLLLATVAFGLLLHRSVLGRYITTVGVSSEAARYSGVPTEEVVTRVFVLSGATAGVAALLLLSRLGVARYDHARGLELDVITAVVLGGTSIFGGRGTVFGSIVALLLIATLQTGMGVSGVTTEIQVTAVGILLITALLLAKITQRT